MIEELQSLINNYTSTTNAQTHPSLKKTSEQYTIETYQIQQASQQINLELKQQLQFYQKNSKILLQKLKQDIQISKQFKNQDHKQMVQITNYLVGFIRECSIQQQIILNKNVNTQKIYQKIDELYQKILTETGQIQSNLCLNQKQQSLQQEKQLKCIKESKKEFIQELINKQLSIEEEIKLFQLKNQNLFKEVEVLQQQLDAIQQEKKKKAKEVEDEEELLNYQKAKKNDFIKDEEQQVKQNQKNDFSLLQCCKNVFYCNRSIEKTDMQEKLKGNKIEKPEMQNNCRPSSKLPEMQYSTKNSLNLKQQSLQREIKKCEESEKSISAQLESKRQRLNQIQTNLRLDLQVYQRQFAEEEQTKQKKTEEVQEQQATLSEQINQSDKQYKILNSHLQKAQEEVQKKYQINQSQVSGTQQLIQSELSQFYSYVVSLDINCQILIQYYIFVMMGKDLTQISSSYEYNYGDLLQLNLSSEQQQEISEVNMFALLQQQGLVDIKKYKKDTQQLIQQLMSVMSKYNTAEFFKKLIRYEDKDEFMQQIDSHLKKL